MGHCVGVKVSAGLAAALVPAHVLAQVLLPDHSAVHRPLIPRALVRQRRCRGHNKDRTEAVNVVNEDEVRKTAC